MSRGAWFDAARFGLFVHWGPSSLPPGELSWIRYFDRIDDATYQRYVDRFEPDLYDPERWARAAREAGARYVTITTKHHDGFCLWDTALTDFKAPNTPAGRDLLRPFVEAVRAEGLKVGFYYSLLDWNHPDFPIDFLHPLRDRPDAAELNRTRDIARYAGFMEGQLRELLTGYGTVDLLWFDFSYPSWAPYEAEQFERPSDLTLGGKGRTEWRSERLLALVRELQPDILVNDRLDLPGDFLTPETHQPLAAPTSDGGPSRWEMSMTVTGTWAYDRDDLDPRPAEQIARSLIDAVSKGGNLVLNVGPTGRGEIDPPSLATLAEIGEWLRRHGRAIHGAGPSAHVPPADARYTQRGDRLYLHLLSWPYGHVYLEGLGGRVEYAQLLHDASALTVAGHDPDQVVEHPLHYQPSTGVKPGSLSVALPRRRPDVLVPVVELFLRDTPTDH